MNSTVAIVGVGDVGAAAANALILGSVCKEVILVDLESDMRNGQVRDLIDASCCQQSSTRVREGTHKEAGQCDVIAITAGSKRTLGETSIQALHRQISIMHSIINAMKPLRDDTILLVVSNPVDLMTYFAQALSGLPESQVLGCGTYLDTVRLRSLLAKELGIAASSVDAYVLGESGKSEFVAWSVASIAGIPINDALPHGSFDHNKIADDYKCESQLIVQEKGRIEFGIGSLISNICSSILFDKGIVCPISYVQPDLGCSLSMPVVLGRKGIGKTIQIPLNREEKAKFVHSAKQLKEVIDIIRSDFMNISA